MIDQRPVTEPGDDDLTVGKSGGTWEYMDAGAAKQGGIWKRTERTYVKEAGVWKTTFDYCKCQVRGGCTCHGVSTCSCYGQCACNARGCSCNGYYTTPECTGVCAPGTNPTCSSVNCGWYGGCGCFGRCCDCMHRTAATVCPCNSEGCYCVSDGGSLSTCPCNVYYGCDCDNRGVI